MYLHSLPYLAVTVILSSMVKCSPLPETQKSVLELIRELQPTCIENPLLNETKNAQLSQCNEIKALNKIGLNCFSFLDINRRLCDLSRVSHFNWSQTFRVEEYKNYTPEQICSDSKYIFFGDVPEYPKYKDTMQTAFEKKESCIKLCMGDNIDVFDFSANYFCKVFSYGSNFLKMHETVGKPLNETTVNTINVSTNSNQVKESISEATVPEETVIIVTKKTTPAKVSPIEITKQLGLLPVSTETKAETTSKITSTKPISVEKDVVNEVKPDVEQKSNNNKLDVKDAKTIDDKLTETSERKPPTANHNSINLISPGGSSKGNLETMLANNNSILNHNPLQIPGLNDNQELSSDDDYDHENEGDDKRFEGNGDEDIKPGDDMMQPNNSPKVEGYMPSDMDDYSDEDESSFFPMFFFGICTMVMLYILYHNKNKIMGLLIEGRQSNNRRRTSRGHAYKKLDTLEQAISSNAPGVTTSKIIY